MNDASIPKRPLMNSRMLSEIWLYPVKSLGGYRIPASRVLMKGLEHDRRWMLIDSNNRFLTQRTFPQLALFTARIQGDDLMLGQDGQHLQVPVVARTGDSFVATVWDDEVQVYGCSPAADEWFSDLLHFPVRMVRFPEVHARQADPAYSPQGQWVSLADGYPFLIIGDASLADLNGRLPTPVPMNRFRPNFVFTGGQAYEEDQWRDFTIGSVEFVGVKPCSRCVMTTVDQTTGLKNTEPLATLGGYRRRGGKVYFGQNALAKFTGTVNEGDIIVIH